MDRQVLIPLDLIPLQDTDDIQDHIQWIEGIFETTTGTGIVSGGIETEIAIETGIDVHTGTIEIPGMIEEEVDFIRMTKIVQQGKF